MKYILKSPLLVISCVIAVCLGIFIGCNMTGVFSDIYFRTFMLPVIRYIMLALVMIVHFSLFNLLTGSIVVLRRKNLCSALFFVVRAELIFVALIFILINIPIVILNLTNVIDILDILKMIINAVIISTFLTGIVRIADIFIRNRRLAIGVFICFYVMVDFLLEHYNWFSGEDPFFDFSYMFSLPYVYDYYYYIAAFLIVIIFLINTIYIFVGIKKDCFLRSVGYEEIQY